MKISVIGTGYVGMVTGTCMAELGNNVFCLDVNQSKIDMLIRGQVPIYEPDPKELDGFDLSRIAFHYQTMGAVQGADALVIATEWKAYRSPDFAALTASLRHPVIFDGRNLYDPVEMADSGLAYEGAGRMAPGSLRS